MYRQIAILSSISVLVSLATTNLCLSQPLEVPKAARREPTPGLWQKNLVGGHLGPWFTEDLNNEIQKPNVRLIASRTAFHLEFFYQPHLLGILNLDVNIGAINRGDLRIETPTDESFGDATLYPLGAGIVAYPLARHLGVRVQPSLRVGGSLVIGTERIQTQSVDSYGIGIAQESRTAFGYYFGGGVNVVMSPAFCLMGTVKYQHAKFDKELYGVRDYSGTMVLLGAAYMYR